MPCDRLRLTTPKEVKEKSVQKRKIILRKVLDKVRGVWYSRATPPWGGGG
jgi:hypothetical protein